MKIALLHNHYNQKHLDDVKKEMNILGAPTINFVATK